MTAAAVIGQKVDQRIDAGYFRPVAHEAPFLNGRDQTGLRQGLEMKRKRRRRQFKLLADHPWSQPFGSVAYQQSEDGQAVSLCQGSESTYGMIVFHVSNNMEMLSA